MHAQKHLNNEEREERAARPICSLLSAYDNIKINTPNISSTPAVRSEQYTEPSFSDKHKDKKASSSAKKEFSAQVSQGKVKYISILSSKKTTHKLQCDILLHLFYPQAAIKKMPGPYIRMPRTFISKYFKCTDKQARYAIDQIKKTFSLDSKHYFRLLTSDEKRHDKKSGKLTVRQDQAMGYRLPLALQQAMYEFWFRRFGAKVLIRIWDWKTLNLTHLTKKDMQSWNTASIFYDNELSQPTFRYSGWRGDIKRFHRGPKFQEFLANGVNLLPLPLISLSSSKGKREKNTSELGSSGLFSLQNVRKKAKSRSNQVEEIPDDVLKKAISRPYWKKSNYSSESFLMCADVKPDSDDAKKPVRKLLLRYTTDLKMRYETNIDRNIYFCGKAGIGIDWPHYTFNVGGSDISISSNYHDAMPLIDKAKYDLMQGAIGSDRMHRKNKLKRELLGYEPKWVHDEKKAASLNADKGLIAPPVASAPPVEREACDNNELKRLVESDLAMANEVFEKIDYYLKHRICFRDARGIIYGDIALMRLASLPPGIEDPIRRIVSVVDHEDFMELRDQSHMFEVNARACSPLQDLEVKQTVEAYINIGICFEDMFGRVYGDVSNMALHCLPAAMEEKLRELIIVVSHEEFTELVEVDRALRGEEAKVVSTITDEEYESEVITDDNELNETIDAYLGMGIGIKGACGKIFCDLSMLGLKQMRPALAEKISNAVVLLEHAEFEALRLSV